MEFLIVILKLVGATIVLLTGELPSVAHFLSDKKRIELWFLSRWDSIHTAVRGKSIRDLIRQPVLASVSLYWTLLNGLLGSVWKKLGAILFLTCLFFAFPLIENSSVQDKRLLTNALQDKDLEQILAAYEKTQNTLWIWIELEVENMLLSHVELDDEERLDLSVSLASEIIMSSESESAPSEELARLYAGADQEHKEVLNDYLAQLDATIDERVKVRNALLGIDRTTEIESPYYWVNQTNRIATIILASVGTLLSMFSIFVTYTMVRRSNERGRIRYLALDLFVAVIVGIFAMSAYRLFDSFAPLFAYFALAESPLEEAMQTFSIRYTFDVYGIVDRDATSIGHALLTINGLRETILVSIGSLVAGVRAIFELDIFRIMTVESIRNWTSALVLVPSLVYVSIVFSIFVSSVMPIRKLVEAALRFSLESEGFVLENVHHVLSLLVLAASFLAAIVILAI